MCINLAAKGSEMGDVEIYCIMRRLYIQNLHTGTTFNAVNTVKHKLVETYDNTHVSL